MHSLSRESGFYASCQAEPELAMARAVAQDALTQLGKTGQILQFFESTYHCNNYEEIANAIFQTMAGFGLRVSVQIRDHRSDISFSDRGTVPDLDEKILSHLHLLPDRIINFDQRIVINFDHISLLVKNMPAVPDLCTEIQDNIVRMLHGAEQRIKFLVNQDELKDHHDLAVEKTLQMTQTLLAKVNLAFEAHRKKTNDLVAHLVAGLDDNLSRLGLDEDQEQYFHQLIEATLEKLYQLNDNGLELSDSFNLLVQQIRECL
jgi:hypothetical protein